MDQPNMDKKSDRIAVKILGLLIDESTRDSITASDVVDDFCKEFELTPKDFTVPYPEARANLLKAAAEALREKYENPANSSLEHAQALEEYGRRKFGES